jgi:hypothetical protein
MSALASLPLSGWRLPSLLFDQEDESLEREESEKDGERERERERKGREKEKRECAEAVTKGNLQGTRKPIEGWS